MYEVEKGKKVLRNEWRDEKDLREVEGGVGKEKGEMDGMRDEGKKVKKRETGRKM